MGTGKTTLLEMVSAMSAAAVMVDTQEALSSLRADWLDGHHVLVDFEDPDLDRLECVASATGTAALTVAGRYVSSGVRELLSEFDLVELGAGSLRLDSRDVCDALAAAGVEDDLEPLAEWIVAGCDGWAAPIDLLTGDIQRRGRDALAVTRPIPDVSAHPVVEHFLRSLRETWPSEAARVVERFGGFGRLTLGAFEEVVGPGSMSRLVRAGVPFVAQADGWISLSPLMRRHLGNEPGAEAAREIAPALARTGGLIAATTVLTASSAFDAAAELLLGAAPDQLDGSDPHHLLALVDIVSPNCTSRPELGLIRARALENLGDLAGAAEALEHVCDLAGGGSLLETDAALEVRRSAIMRGNDVGAFQGVVTTASQRARLRETDSLRDALSQDPSRVGAAIDVLRACVAEWESLGFHGRAASLLRTLAAMPLTHLGRYADAIDAVQRARQLSWNRPYDRALCSVLLVLLGARAGRVDLVEREVNAARALRSVVELPWLDFYLSAASVDVEVYRGRIGEAVTQARLATELMDGLADHPTAVTARCQFACSLAVAGRHAEALRYLEEARVHRQRNEAEVLLAEVVVFARCGNVEAAARAADAVERSELVPPDRLWRSRFELGLAVGDQELVDRGRRAGERLRLDSLVEVLSAETSAESVVAALGQLRVKRADGGEILVDGKPGELLAHLVNSGRVSPIESVIEALWPKVTDEQHGRRLLRNPLSRLRRILGKDSITRSEHAVGLHDAVRIDVEDFERLAGLAARERGVGAVTLAVDALNLYRPLLHDRADLGEGNARRTALAIQAAGLLDSLLEHDGADAPSSSWLLSVALRVEPDGDSRFTEIAERALRENNPACAAAAVREALAAVKRLDVPVSARLEAVRTATARS